MNIIYVEQLEKCECNANHNLQLNATNVSLLGRPFNQPDMVEIAGPKSRLRFTTANAHLGIGVAVLEKMPLFAQIPNKTERKLSVLFGKSRSHIATHQLRCNICVCERNMIITIRVWINDRYALGVPNYQLPTQRHLTARTSLLEYAKYAHSYAMF